MSSNLVPCKKCGREIARSAVLCPNCGTSPAIDTGMDALGAIMLVMLAGFLAFVLITSLGNWGVAIVIAGLALLVLTAIGRVVEKRKAGPAPPEKRSA